MGFVRDPAQVALIAVFIMLLKHLVCDYFLQTQYQLANKGTYGHPGGIIHSGIHILGTAFLFLYLTPTIPLGAEILIGEFIVHYHIDWAKEQIVRRMNLTTETTGFWWALGIDQFLHGATYVVIVWILMGARI